MVSAPATTAKGLFALQEDGLAMTSQARHIANRDRRLRRETHKNPQTVLPPLRVDDNHKRGKTRYARVNKSWLFGAGGAINAALKSARETPVKTLADMTPAERAAIEERYGAKIKE